VNALTTQVYREISATFDRLGGSSSGARVVVFTGAGRYFSAGRDLKGVDEESEEARNSALRSAFASILHCSVPVIAAVNGPALGSGLVAVLNCDMIVAATTATFGLPEINAGLGGAMSITKRGFNQYQGRRLAFTGEHITADEMYRLGVVDRVVAPPDLGAEARRLAEVLAAKSPTALRAAKWSANEVEKLIDFEQAYRAIESRLTISLAASDDHREAVAAFREKRAPNFKGE
jgi:enoyl-CoA hydratase/carnithine racemase